MNFKLKTLDSNGAVFIQLNSAAVAGHSGQINYKKYKIRPRRITTYMSLSSIFNPVATLSDNLLTFFDKQKGNVFECPYIIQADKSQLV